MSAKPIRNFLAAPERTLSGRIKALFQRARRLMPTRAEARRQRALRWLGPLLEREWLWRMNRRAVASGVALGVFFGLIVPVAQIPFAAAGALLLRANLPAAVLATLVSNPLTVPPIYWLAHRTGAAILEPSEPERVVASAADDLEAAHTISADWIQRITDVGAPLMLGLSLFAACGAMLAYLAVRPSGDGVSYGSGGARVQEKLAPSTGCIETDLRNPGITDEQRKSILSCAACRLLQTASSPSLNAAADLTEPAAPVLTTGSLPVPPSSVATAHS
ncbi:DUF2062 domain-containing protein [Propionivibrio sp.]|uniref:DUF2062 domain-containing protein n=1 Tax=Propionivibrio sp. TaxID=2212460 RepID=UPI0025DE4C4F|nr:DUF2062 domain-containing protein [Propionivibrio sp.]MBK8744587.1 DUF2062 domain-containing protein [Propionivibrio sp.]